MNRRRRYSMAVNVIGFERSSFGSENSTSWLLFSKLMQVSMTMNISADLQSLFRYMEYKTAEYETPQNSLNQELRNIWQHVVRRKVESKSKGFEDEDVEENGHESDDPSAQKKPGVVWSIDLHRKFVVAVNQLGIEKAIPKRILDLINVDGITRENVASHLQ
ncbi:hypothetical protein L2E82_03819 [Cichorium intybus]|uniref:Uncharacterized protein n=1 Tax=Cichorium intybus TaxID=13427 RepID=A0ACB9H5J4_CICIN|nr:hypothetical protein L2E82_03819 [Cichorium intybus]